MGRSARDPVALIVLFNRAPDTLIVTSAARGWRAATGELTGAPGPVLSARGGTWTARVPDVDVPASVPTPLGSGEHTLRLRDLPRGITAWKFVVVSDHGVQALSEFAGAAEYLRDAPLVNPDAAAGLGASVHDVHAWASAFLGRLERATLPPVRSVTPPFPEAS